MKNTRRASCPAGGTNAACSADGAGAAAGATGLGSCAPDEHADTAAPTAARARVRTGRDMHDLRAAGRAGRDEACEPAPSGGIHGPTKDRGTCRSGGPPFVVRIERGNPAEAVRAPGSEPEGGRHARAGGGEGE